MCGEAAQAATSSVVGTRVLDAPVDEVWRAWVEPELIKQRWGPTGFTVAAATTQAVTSEDVDGRAC